jgi:hypothetical protein
LCLIGGHGGVLINDAIYLGGALGSSITEIGGGYSSYIIHNTCEL